jgi:hypothetical protein
MTSAHNRSRSQYALPTAARARSSQATLARRRGQACSLTDQPR